MSLFYFRLIRIYIKFSSFCYVYIAKLIYLDAFLWICFDSIDGGEMARKYQGGQKRKFIYCIKWIIHNFHTFHKVVFERKIYKMETAEASVKLPEDCSLHFPQCIKLCRTKLTPRPFLQHQHNTCWMALTVKVLLNVTTS